MDASSSKPSNPNPTASSASKCLENLPSRGYFSSTVVSANPGRMRVYVCVRDTSPPEDQEIKTNQQNILIRSLMIRNSNSKEAKGVVITDPSRKRASEGVSDSKPKRANAQISSVQEGSSSSEVSSKDFRSLTVERLRNLLKARGLSPKGKKDELIARLRSVDT